VRVIVMADWLQRTIIKMAEIKEKWGNLKNKYNKILIILL